MKTFLVSLFLFSSVTLYALSEKTEKKPLNVYDKFQQNDYKLKYERSDVVRYNKKIFNYFSIITFKYNRTTPASNGTFNYCIDPGYKLMILVQVQKFMSNEYRYFPIRFQVNFCAAMLANLIGSKNFAHCGNFTVCPSYKDQTYHVCNWAPDSFKFPPAIPDGRYRADVYSFYDSEEAFLVYFYFAIERPISY